MGQGFPSQRLGINASAGTLLANTGTIVLSNSNNISFGMSFSASSYVITASAASAGGIGAIAAGTQTATSGTVVFSNSNGITFGMNGSSQITASVVGPSGIAAGTQTATSGTVSFANSNGISFGMAGSATITAQLPSVSLFKPDGEHENPILMQGSSNAINLSLRRVSIPFGIMATQLDIPAHLSLATTAGSFTISAALYTFSGSTASSLSSASVQYSFSSSNYTNNSGTRWRSMSLATWNVTPGEYLMAVMGSINGPSGTTGSITMFGLSSLSMVGAPNAAGNYSNYFADGVFSTGTGAFPASIHLSAIEQTGAHALGQPHFRLIGTGP